MDQVTSSQIIDFVKNPVFLLVAAWLAREIYSLSKKKVSDYDNALKELSDKLASLTIAITRLEARLEFFDKFIEGIPKMRDDVAAIHAKLRDQAT